MSHNPVIYASPSHWHLGENQVTLLDPATLAIDKANARACLAVLQPLWQAEGWELLWQSTMLWRLHAAARHTADIALALADLAPLADCIGQDIRPLLPTDPNLRCLLAATQMLLYTWPGNDVRTSQGLPSINGVWLHSPATRHQNWGYGLWSKLTLKAIKRQVQRK